MSSYRDDTQETVVASSSVWLGLRSLTEDVARTSSALVFGLLVLHADAVAISDLALDRAGTTVVEHAVLSDQVIDARRCGETVLERAAALDQVLGRLRVLHADGAQVADSVVDHTAALAVDQLGVSDVVFAQRRAFNLVQDTGRVTDQALSFASSLSLDFAQVREEIFDSLRAATVCADAAVAGDVVLDERHSAAPASDQVRVDTTALGLLHAMELVRDGVLIEDAMVGSAGGGQAWTSNMDSWAMSRYDPLGFDSLVVIDGALYGLAEDGVYALDTATMQAAVIRTAPVDLGQGMLVHPLQAFLEYELEEGTATMEVTTTQSGDVETYAYALQPELAKRLTNGRFEFGRGLRGRHFSFALRFDAKRGHINDLSVNVAPTKRRV